MSVTLELTRMAPRSRAVRTIRTSFSSLRRLPFWQHSSAVESPLFGRARWSCVRARVPDRIPRLGPYRRAGRPAVREADCVKELQEKRPTAGGVRMRRIQETGG